MGTLDATMYPHLVDAIFAHADARALLHLRTANRAWRHRANTLLCVHLAFFGSGVVGAVAYGSMIRHPAFHTFFDGTAVDWRDATGAHRVVDFVGLGEEYTTPTGFFDTAPPVMRMWENCWEDDYRSEPYTAAETVVVFAWRSVPFADPGLGSSGPSTELGSADDGNGDTTVAGSEEDDVSERVDHHYTPINYLGVGTRKLVVNLSSASLIPNELEFQVTTFAADWVDSCETLEEIVLILALDDLPTELDEASQLPRRLMDSLFTITENSGVKHTIVNAAAFPSNSLHLVPHENIEDNQPKTWDKFQNGTSLQECAEFFFRDLFEGSEDEMPEVEWLSYEEYEARVGADSFRLETMECPWPA